MSFTMYCERVSTKMMKIDIGLGKKEKKTDHKKRS